jgi:hypothetical protein
VLRASDGLTLDPSKFASQVEPGMVLEMSIVLWQGRVDQPEKCPRCGYINLDGAVKNGWIEWPVSFKLSI